MVMKVFILLKITLISFVLTSCFEQTKKTPYENYISCLKELPDKSGNKTIHESICFNKYSRVGFGKNVTGNGYIGFNRINFNSYTIINKSSDIVKINQISNTIENKNNPEETVVVTLNCEQKQVGPLETTVIKCFYAGVIGKEDFKELDDKLSSKDKVRSWDIVSTSHLSP